ncbi:MAG TPA: hypothetical protein VN426_05060 [Syntrophomonadaceae bacterium]|nr:hypothetical protein [Syntrophomonadaceae bacterium]
MEEEEILGMFVLPRTVVGSEEWELLEKKENSIGTEALFEEIISKKLWSNAEISWVLKRLVYHFGKKDSLIKKAPPERLASSMSVILRAFYLVFDLSDPLMEDNTRSYICSKLVDATWGINQRTRTYLEKIAEKNS